MRVNYRYAGIKENEIMQYEGKVKTLHDVIHEKTGAGNDFLGWTDYTDAVESSMYDKVKEIASEMRSEAEALIVVGIGGSYLGSRAVIDALTHSFRKDFEVYFAGNSISGTYLKELMDVVKEKNVYVNVISKSGTTTEPAIAFRYIKNFMEEKYGKEESRKRIIATTDKARGALRTLAEMEGYRTFIIPDDVGGRFSVFTPVGLLPIAAAGVDVDELIAGVREGMKEYANPSLKENEAYKYAVLRNILLEGGKDVEILVNYEPKMTFVAEWFKQLYGESEGKENKGIFPASVSFSADLHSMGQYIQEGQRFLFETVINFLDAKEDVVIPSDENNLDGLNYIAGKTLNHVNERAQKGTILAHVSGGVPNLVLDVPKLDARNLGKLLFFFMKACAMSGYILGVNPFNQPGVESYKKNMFALLGKPGFEELSAKLKGELNE